MVMYFFWVDIFVGESGKEGVLFFVFDVVVLFRFGFLGCFDCCKYDGVDVFVYYFVGFFVVGIVVEWC